MGKNKDIKSLIGLVADTVVHELVAMHTNRPESESFLKSEIAEYRGQAEESYEEHTWNEEDKVNIKNNALKEVARRMTSKYPDVSFDESEIEEFVDKEMKRLGGGL